MRSISVAKRVLKQVVKDKRTLALLFMAPLFIIFLLYAVMGGDMGKPKIEAVGLPTEIVFALKNEAEVKIVNDKSIAITDLKNRKTDAVVTYADPNVAVSVEGSQMAVTAAVKKAVATAISSYSKVHVQAQVSAQIKAQEKLAKQKLLVSLQKQMKPGSSSQTLDIDLGITNINIPMTSVNYSFINGSDDISTFDAIAPLMMGFFIFFFVFIIAGVAFLRERTSGTLDRILATPIKRIEIVLGYFLGFGVFVLLQTLVIQLFMFYCLHIVFKGSFLLVLLINILLASGSLSLGTLLSAFARNELQMFQFIPIVIVPQILLCGLFNLRGAPLWVNAISKIFPLTYACDAITNVAVRGLGAGDIALDLVIMAAYTAMFITMNSLALKNTEAYKRNINSSVL